MVGSEQGMEWRLVQSMRKARSAPSHADEGYVLGMYRPSGVPRIGAYCSDPQPPNHSLMHALGLLAREASGSKPGQHLCKAIRTHHTNCLIGEKVCMLARVYRALRIVSCSALRE